jgi:hypothetical protein
MIPQEIKNSELDKIMQQVMQSSDDLNIPRGMVDRTIQKLEKRILLRELLLELSFKFGLVLGCLGILAGVLLWFSGSDVLNIAVDFIIQRWQMMASLLVLVFVTILIDQVGLRYYDTLNNKVSLNG